MCDNEPKWASHSAEIPKQCGRRNFKLYQKCQPTQKSADLPLVKFLAIYFLRLELYAYRWFIVIGLHSTALCCMCVRAVCALCTNTHTPALPPYLIYITLGYCECVMVHSMWETRVHAHLFVFFLYFFVVVVDTLQKYVQCVYKRNRW